VGTKQKLLELLKPHEDTIRKYQFAYLDYLEFADRKEDVEIIKGEIESRLKSLYDDEFASSWRKYS
jgi:hypothetical protein